MNFQEIKSVLSNKTVGIAGAGGLGSNCAVALARVGIGCLIICDFDVVSASNLNRQFYFYEQIGYKKSTCIKKNIHLINPQIKIDALDIRLSEENIPGIFKNCDVIVEAFDLAAMKEMIIETVLEKLSGIPLITGLGMAGWGDSNILKVKRVGNLYICGDEKSEIAEHLPPLAPRVGIVANMQANTVLEILLKEDLNENHAKQ